MTPQLFVDWGKRMADQFADQAQRVNPHDAEYDECVIAADHTLRMAEDVENALDVPGAEEKIAACLASNQFAGPAGLPPNDTEMRFSEIYKAVEPIVDKALVGMWLGEWEFNDSGLIGTLRISETPGGLQILYTNSEGIVYETEIQEFWVAPPRRQRLKFSVKTVPNGHWVVEAHMFRWDRAKMAGIVSGGGAPGVHAFYAFKRTAIPSSQRE